ncbi:hypothetical protein [Gaetbulibacter jejuensis]|uniref:Uncharacterized protein n=1 Tax=Gaetbulibacter jejuensis TaxID=584607 RepID=A0ABP3USK4_9FLAO
MEKLFFYIELEFKEKFNLKLTNKGDKLIIKNNYYCFKLKERNGTFEMTHFWKYGLLNIVFRKQYENMLELFEAIIDYSKKSKISITQTYYN